MIKHAVQGKEAPVFPVRVVWIEAHGGRSVEIASLDAEFPWVAGAADALRVPCYTASCGGGQCLTRVASREEGGMRGWG
jgi:hypothetical protein